MDHFFIPSTKTFSCRFLSLLALVFSLQLPMLSQASLPFSFIGSTNGSSSSNCIHNEKLALLQLKSGFLIVRGEYNSSFRLDSWNPAIDCCSWEGITCDEGTGHVIGLDLSSSIDAGSSWVRGPIDSSLFNLHSLQKLNLSLNNFSPHPIPSGVGHLTNLTHLNLSYSQFSGQIPFEISRLTKLVSLDLSSNNLKLKHPNLTTLIGNLSSLQELFLDRVNISREHGGKWAQAISIAMPNLQRLSLRGCGLQGPIDASLFWIPDLSQLEYLDFSSNNFGGMIPSSISNLTELKHLDLSSNNFGGMVPSSFSNFTQLEHLDLSSNNFGGMIPSSFSNLTQLEHLDLSSNNFGGMVPSSISNLTQLKHLDLSSNNFGGMVPSSFSNLTQLEHLDLSSNNFNGTVLSLISNLTQLENLYLSSNNFGGMVPSSISNLTQLEYFYLSSNNFGGMVPSSISNLTQLEYLDLSSNNFSGTLPSSIANLTQLELLVLSSNNFSGTIPPSYGDELKHLIVLELYDNSLEGSIPSSLFSHPTLRHLFLFDNQFSGYLPDSHNESSSVLERIVLNNNKLQGTIPRLFFELTMLRYLVLSNNSFNEFPDIPQSLNQLKYLDLSENNIHGEIPTWIWEVGNRSLYHLNLSKNFLEGFEHPLPEFSSISLGVIDLHSNKLQGSLPVMPHKVFFHDYSNNNLSSSIPASINFTSTQYFFLSGNNVSGEIPLSICKAHFLEVLDLSRNNLSGNIPTCLGKIGNSLKILNLQRNAFQGNVPDTFKKECGLRTLNLDSNELEGPIPKSLTNCKTLEVIDLGNNRLNDTFPFWFDSLSDLRILILRSNKFHGPIAHSHAKNLSFQFLQIFDISSNSFVGIIPPNFFVNWKLMEGGGLHSSSNNQVVKYELSRYGLYYQDSVMVTMKGLYLEVVKIITALTSVDLSNNRFEGEIPKSICNLKLLHVLNFSQNGFDGSIPTSLENLTQLESLDLSRNKLSGNIPWQLTKLTFLAVLNLSQNLLQGRIPQSQQFLTFTNNSFLGNIGLCGLPLSTKCGDTQATPPSVFGSFGLDGEREIDWRFMWIGSGVGFGFGFGSVFWTLALWKKGSRKYMQLIDRMCVHGFSSDCINCTST